MSKYRYWAFVTYPESLPENYFDQMRLTGLKFAVSPLHDKDVNPDGSPKKPHFHNIVAYDGPTTFNAVSKAIEFLNGTIPIPLQSPRGYYRYFTHEDNPEKYQYSTFDIVTVNGFDVTEYFSSGDVTHIINAINDIVIDSQIGEYADLVDYCRTNHPEWCSIVCRHTLHFNALCRSIRYSAAERELAEPVDLMDDEKRVVLDLDY